MDAEKLSALRQQAETLANYWKMVINDYPPDCRQWLIWLGNYTPEIVEKGIAAMAMRLDRGHLSRFEKVRYASACMRNIKAGTKPPSRVRHG